MQVRRLIVLTRLPLTGLGHALLWLGYFGPWLHHRAAALTMNAYDMSEWITFLPQIRDGSLMVGRLHLLGLLALTIFLTGTWAFRSRRRWWALGLPVLGLAMLLPGYPFILGYQTDPEVQSQLGLLAVTTAAVGLGVRMRDVRFAIVLQALAATASVGLSTWCLLTVRPIFVELYGVPPSMGWGWFAMNAGLILLLSASVMRVLRQTIQP